MTSGLSLSLKVLRFLEPSDVQVAFDSGTSSGVFRFLTCRQAVLGLETDLFAATPFVLVPAFFCRLRGAGRRRVACRDDGSCRAFRWVTWTLAAILFLGCAFRWLWWFMLAATGTRWSFCIGMVAGTCYAAQLDCCD